MGDHVKCSTGNPLYRKPQHSSQLRHPGTASPAAMGMNYNRLAWVDGISTVVLITSGVVFTWYTVRGLGWQVRHVEKSSTWQFRLRIGSLRYEVLPGARNASTIIH